MPGKAAGVLVVGAGPVGLTLACELLRRGVAVRMVDKEPHPTDESRAVAVHARTMEALYVVGVVEELLDRAQALGRVTVHAGGSELAGFDLSTVDSPYPFTAGLPQTATEEILRRRLHGLGGSIDRPVTFVSLRQDEDSVTATLAAPGRTEEFRCEWLVGADGSRSAVRAAVGTRLEGSFKGERFTLADVDVEHSYDPGTMHIFAHPSGPLLLIPMSEGRARVMAETDVPLNHQLSLEEVQAVADARAGGIKMLRAHWLNVFEIHHAQVPTYRFGRVFLVGDAAHIHSPAGGQGMNTGMQDAFNLAWKLHYASRGMATAALLDSYQRERHPVAHKVIVGSSALTKLATVRRGSTQRLRSLLLPMMAGLGPVQRLVANTTEEINIAYRQSDIVLSDGRWPRRAVRPGQHAPEVSGLPSVGERRTLWEVFDRTEHTVLHLPSSADGPELVTAGLAAGLQQRYGRICRQLIVLPAAVPPNDAVTQVIDHGGRVAERFGTTGRSATFVIRPDGYVGYRTTRPTVQGIGGYFDLIAGRAE